MKKSVININKNVKTSFGSADSVGRLKLFSAMGIQHWNDKIYVADNAEMKIKVFDQNGKLLKNFGGRGRGPGEFISMKGFKVINGEILLFDQNLQRMNKFKLTGEFITSYNIKGIQSPVKIYSIKDNYLLLYPSFDNDKTYFAHIYNEKFSKVHNSFIDLNEFVDEGAVTNRLFMAWLGNIYVGDKGNKIYYVPYFYDGQIFIFTKNDEWQLSDVKTGVLQQDPFLFIDKDHFRRPDITHSSVTINSPIRIIAKNTTRGLYKTGDYFYHFTFTDVGEYRIFGMEIYNDNFSSIGFSPIDSVKISNQRFNFLAWNVDDIDNNGNFYFRERYQDGMRIRIIKFGLNKQIHVYRQ
ncbi:6-bladed beta-propeller [Aliifodinibius sp. S!AR15-10]|uniref:6-bladed beta-propeller n=1 Tax=Aliifodinibius sp. S!AR15-10 TaxID=2950437 RepID=UPI00285E5CC9|nr:6-bladed beta-propeller [Aliifodinibius sp. S!AR15-10]MDR8393816.1 6-bladed beta-propeller [Aliifodinibius sp. S!AR15-10]